MWFKISIMCVVLISLQYSSVLWYLKNESIYCHIDMYHRTLTYSDSLWVDQWRLTFLFLMLSMFVTYSCVNLTFGRTNFAVVHTDWRKVFSLINSSINNLTTIEQVSLVKGSMVNLANHQWFSKQKSSNLLQLHTINKFLAKLCSYN